MATKAKAKLITRPHVDRELRKLGEVELDLAAAQADMLRELSEAKARHASIIAPLKAKVDALSARLLASCQQARGDLFPPDAQTLKLGFGKIAYRTTSARVAPADGIEDAEVLRRLRARRLRRYYTTRHSIDRAALAKAATGNLLSSEALAALGLAIIPGAESWTVATDSKAIKAALGQPKGAGPPPDSPLYG